VIDISTSLNDAYTINNLSSLIEFKTYLAQAVEIAVWMCAHQKGDLWLGEPDFSSPFHRTFSFAKLTQPYQLAVLRTTIGHKLPIMSATCADLGAAITFVFLVASSPVRDLLFFAKHLFVAARTVWHGTAADTSSIFDCRGYRHDRRQLGHRGVHRRARPRLVAHPGLQDGTARFRRSAEKSAPA
jgi:hypothetical protein